MATNKPRCDHCGRSEYIDTDDLPASYNNFTGMDIELEPVRQATGLFKQWCEDCRGRSAGKCCGCGENITNELRQDDGKGRTYCTSCFAAGLGHSGYAQ